MLSSFSQKAILYRLNVDKPPARALGKSFHLKGIPTVVLLGTDGKEIDRIIGYGDRVSWTRTFLGYLFNVGTLNDLLNHAKQSPSAASGKEIADKYLQRSDADNALLWVAKAESKLTPKDSALKTELALIRGEALLSKSPPEGEALLAKLAASDSKKTSEEAFSILSSHYRRTAKSEKDAGARKMAQTKMLDLYHALLPKRQDDSHFLNDYAWHTAELGVELDQALASAQRAVLISKEDPGILDTLAEVYYKMGNSAKALETIGKALAQKPNDKYFLGQKAKFEGKKNSSKAG